MTNAPPLSPPNSLRVLGIISIVLAVLGMAWSIAAMFLSINNVESFASSFSFHPDTYTTWVVVMGVANIAHELLQFVAGIGLTMRTRWGRKLALLFAFTGIPLTIAMFIGTLVIVGALDAAAANANVVSYGGPYLVESKIYSGATCFTPVLGILFLSLLFSPSVRRWAKGPSANYRPIFQAPADLPAAVPAVAQAAAPAAIGTGSPLPMTHDAQAALPFTGAPAPQMPASPMTLHATATLTLASSSAALPLAGTVATFASTPNAPTAPAQPIPTSAAPFGSPQNAPNVVAYAALPQPVESRLSMLSLFGFLLALCPILPVLGQITALILSNMGLRRIARSQGTLHGRGLAIAGVIIAGIWLILVLVIIVIAIIVSSSTSTT